MSQFSNCVYQGTTVVLDGSEYRQCKFLNCRVVVTRGNFSLHDCEFDGCNFEFGGEAENIKALVLSLMNQTTTPAVNRLPGA